MEIIKLTDLISRKTYNSYLSSAARFLMELLRTKKTTCEIEGQGEVLVLSFTKNQSRAVSPLAGGLISSCFQHFTVIIEKRSANIIYYKSEKKYVIGNYFNTKINLIKIAIKTMLQGKFKSISWSHVARSYDSALFIEKIIKNKNIRGVLMATHHGLDVELMLGVCARNNVKCGFMQHAGWVFRGDPSRFNFGLIEGPKSVEGILRMTSSMSAIPLERLYLCGHSKPRLAKRRQHGGWRRRMVGLAINPNSDPVPVARLVQKFRSVDLGVVIRFHPAQSPTDVEMWRQKLGPCKETLQLQMASEQDLNSFFDSIDLLVASNSSIVLEACLSRFPAAVIRIEKEGCPLDVYGFVAEGVVLQFKIDDVSRGLIDEVCRHMQSDKFEGSAARYDTGFLMGESYSPRATYGSALSHCMFSEAGWDVNAEFGGIDVYEPRIH